MNWGYRIALFFMGFAVFILYLVTRSFNETIDLVAEDYYNQEIAYDQQMERIRNTNLLTQKILFTQDENQVFIQFPKDLPMDGLKGSIHLFRPSDASKDFVLPLRLDVDRKQNIPKDRLIKGMYRVKIRCVTGNKDYFFEEIIHI